MKKLFFFMLWVLILCGCSNTPMTSTPTPHNVLIVPTQAYAPTRIPKVLTLDPKPQKINEMSIARVPTFTATATFTPTPYDWYPFWGCPGLSYPDKPVVLWFFGMELSDEQQLEIGEPLSRWFYEYRPNTLCPLLAPKLYSASDIFYTHINSGLNIDLLGPISSWRYENLQNDSFHTSIDDLWLDLTPLMEQDNAEAALLDPQQYDQAMIHAHQREDGQLFGLPISTTIAAFQYNPELFDRAGLNYPPKTADEPYILPDGSRVPWSWDTVAKVGRLLTLDIDGHNVTEPGFDTKNIEQYGFTWGWIPLDIGQLWGGGSFLARGDSVGQYVAQIPPAWQTAWQWTYDGLHGQQPFIINNPKVGDGSKTPQRLWAFQNGQAAMAMNVWYPDWINEQNPVFQLAALPSYQGKIHTMVYTLDFYILKNSDQPKESFSSLSYIFEHGNPYFVTGSLKKPAPLENNIPSRLADRQIYFDLQKQKFPWVTTWDALLTGLTYPKPAELGYIPNSGKLYDRIWNFHNQIEEGGIDLATQEARLLEDLTIIFNQ